MSLCDGRAQEGYSRMNRISSWWSGLGRTAKIVVAVVVVVLALGGIGALAGPPATETTASAAPGEANATESAAAVVATETATTESPSTEPTPEATPEATPQATPEATPEPTPAPTPKPTAAPPILKTSGKGDKIVKFAAQDGPTYARITGKGSGNFAVISYTGSTYGDLLVNEIGSYSGSVYVAPGIDRFKVTASSSWTIEVQPITSAKHWDGTAALTGKGDSVVNLTGGANGITTIKNKGQSNFAVQVFTQDGDYLDLLVNEIGSYSGEVMLPDSDPMVLVIEAVGGSWSFSAVQL